MQMAILGMLAAILVVQHSASVLPLAACALLGAAGVVGAPAVLWLRPGGRRMLVCIGLGAVLGLAYSSTRAHWRLADQLDPALDGATISLAGHVAGLPTVRADSLHFLLAPAPPTPGVPTRLSV